MALHTAKEIAKIAVTSGLSTEIIGLLEKKIALLTEQITTLETENTNLKQKVRDIEQQLDRLRPKDDLDPQAVKFLQILASYPGLGIGKIANFLGVREVRAEYHRDNLMAAEMIGYHGPIVEIGSETYALRSKGREYLAKHGHI
jgi:septal ring factor EnvC (AmiA/AmiB activator)